MKATSMPSLAFVVVAFRNSVSDVEELCSSLLTAGEQAKARSTVYLVLNDDSSFPEVDGVTVIQGHGNVGFAAGIALGVRAASEDVVIMVNPDCKPDVKEFVEFIARMDCSGAITVPRLCKDDGSFDYMPYENWTFTIGRYLSEKMCKYRLLQGMNEDLPRYAKISGAFLGMDRILAEKLDCPFDSAYFLYAEDRDLTDRVRKMKIPIRFLRDVRITHSGGESGRTVSDLVERCKTDGSLRVAYRRYGRLGAAVYAFDQLAVDLVKSWLRRPVARASHQWAIARWGRSNFTDPGRLDEEILSLG